jgi:hypothetical protein
MDNRRDDPEYLLLRRHIHRDVADHDGLRGLGV